MKLKNRLLNFCIELVASFVAINIVFVTLGDALQNINKALKTFIICLCMVLIMNLLIPFLTKLLKIKR